jgi:hypothetical protein
MVRLGTLLAALSLTAARLGLADPAARSGLSGSSSSANQLGPLKPDSKVARNVLEGKAEGYCSVRRNHPPSLSFPFIAVGLASVSGSLSLIHNPLSAQQLYMGSKFAVSDERRSARCGAENAY